jgi:hypothetical protein
LETAEPTEFEGNWDNFLAEWQDQKKWIKYMKNEWLPIKERWVKAWRSVSCINIYLYYFYLHSL